MICVYQYTLNEVDTLDKLARIICEKLYYKYLMKIKWVVKTLLIACSIPFVQAEEINSFPEAKIASNSIESTILEQELDIEKPVITHDPSKCDEFEDPKSIHCLGPVQATRPTNRLDRFVQGTAIYVQKFVPLLNNNSEGSAYSNKMMNDGKSLVAGKAYGLANETANSQIQKIPFFAQTSIAINAAGESDTSFTIDSLMKLKTNQDSDGDLKTILFGQARGTTTTSNSDGTTTNLGLGLRHRPNDVSMIGGNVFWDYRMTDYSSAHSRLGLGGEYFWKNFELRNNYYMAITDKKKDLTIDGTTYTERVVPGWDAEVGYRLPNYPQLGVFVKAFNWDYEDTDDQSSVAYAATWQATPHINLEAYVSSEISGHGTKANSKLPGTDDYQVGIQVKLTGQPVKFKKNNFKKNIVTQMTQPVRRRYDVLLERSTGAFQNRAAGT